MSTGPTPAPRGAPKQQPYVRTTPVYVMPTLIVRGVRAALGLPPLPVAVFHVRAR